MKYKPCLEVLQRALSVPPYSAGFSSFIVQSKRKASAFTTHGMNFEQLLSKASSDLRDFDCYRLCTNPESDLRELEKVVTREGNIPA